MQVKVDLRARASPSSTSIKPGPKKPGIMGPGTLAGFLPFAMVLLSCMEVSFPCVIVLLGAKSLSGSLRVAKPRGSSFDNWSS